MLKEEAMNRFTLQRNTVVAALSLLAALNGCATTAENERESFVGNSEPRGNFGGVMVAQAEPRQANAKVIVVSFGVSNSGWEVRDSVVAYGSGGVLAGGGDDYTVELVGSGDETLSSVAVWDPRKAVVEQEGIVVNEQGTLAVRLPFSVEATAVRVRDREGRTEVEYDVRAALEKFCRTAGEDPDCAKLTGKVQR
jgi:hypothetical protein